jgi:hypothetical protein
MQRAQSTQATHAMLPATASDIAVPMLPATAALPVVPIDPATAVLATVTAELTTPALAKVAADPPTAVLATVAADPATAVLATVAVDPAVEAASEWPRWRALASDDGPVIGRRPVSSRGTADPPLHQKLALGFAQPAPNPVGLTHREGMGAALSDHRATAAHLLGAHLALRPGTSPLTVGMEEHRRVDTPAKS